MIFLFIVSYVFCTIITYRIVRATLPFFYLLFFGVMFTGTVLGLDQSLETDIYYFYLIMSFLFCYTATSVIFNTKYSISKEFSNYMLKPIYYDSDRVIKVFWFLVMLSALLTLLYFYLVGENIFFMIINDYSQAEITTARVNAYSGETYFAPGYFNQFKNVLLPVSLVILLLNKSKYARLLQFIFIPLAFFGLVGTGQRAFLVYTFLCLLISYYYLGRLKIKYFILPTAIVFFSFGAGSFYLGRTQDMNISSIVGNLLTRIFYNEQHESLITFRYLYKIPIVYGYDWYRGIVGIFPGIKGSEIQHIVFGLIHGNPRGTAALSFIGSIYHNFGFIGVMLISSLFSFLINNFTYVFLKKKKLIGNIVFFSFITFYISIYSSGDIVFLFNKGVVLLILLSYLIYKVRFKWEL